MKAEITNEIFILRSLLANDIKQLLRTSVMPLPIPNEGECQGDFIARFIANENILKDIPDSDQRLAFAFGQFRSRSSTSTLIPVLCEVGTIRTEKFNDIEHTVIPIVAMVEGVRHAANATNPELVLATEFGRFPVAWNGRPVTIDHPQVRGQMVSANIPTVLEDVQVGHIFNPEVDDKKLKMEAWIDPLKLDEDGTKILEKVTSGEVTEVSVGMFVEVEPIEGTFNGEKFTGIWRNVIPDHLALLSEGKIGACSNKDGCGTGRFAECCEPTTFSKILENLRSLFKLKNAKDISDFDRRAAIQAAVEAGEEWGFVIAVFENTFIMEMMDGLFERSFSISEEGTISIGSEKTQVRPETTFVKVKMETNEMSKDTVIAALIENKATMFEEAHTEWLKTLEDGQLALLVPKVVEKKVDTNKPEPKAAEETPVKPKTLEEYIDEAPSEIASMLRSNLEQAEAIKQEHITVIKTNERNTFTDEQLKDMDISTLKSLVSLATTEDFTGRGTPIPVKVSETHAVEPRKLFVKTA